jgi:hypothetical protein
MAKKREKRYHGVIRDKNLSDRAKQRMEFENKTFEELFRAALGKYESTSGEIVEIFAAKHTELAKDLARAYKKPSLRDLMNAFWIIIERCISGEYSIELILTHILPEIKFGRYKNPDYIESKKQIEGAGKMSKKEFFEKWSPHPESKEER